MLLSNVHAKHAIQTGGRAPPALTFRVERQQHRHQREELAPRLPPFAVELEIGALGGGEFKRAIVPVEYIGRDDKEDWISVSLAEDRLAAGSPGHLTCQLDKYAKIIDRGKIGKHN